MPLNVKLEVVNAQYTMLLSDVTGDYNATTNPEGWGAPNTTRASITAIDCTVLAPGQITPYTLSGLITSSFWTTAYRQVDIFALLPTSPDGLYTVTVVFNPTDPSEFTETFQFLRYEAAKAVLAQLALQSNVNFEQLKFIYDKMVYAEQTGNHTLAATLLGEFNSLVVGCGNTGLSGDCGC